MNKKNINLVMNILKSQKLIEFYNIEKHKIYNGSYGKRMIYYKIIFLDYKKNKFEYLVSKNSDLENSELKENIYNKFFKI